MRYETTIDIEAPPHRVWQVLADVARWPEWTASIRDVTPLAPGPLAVDMLVRVRQPRLPTAVWRVTEFEVERGFVWVSENPGLVSVAGHYLEPSGAGHAAHTTVRLSISQSGLFAPVAAALASGLTRRYVNMEAAGLKRRCETT